MKRAAKLFFDKIVYFLPKVTKQFKCKQKTQYHLSHLENQSVNTLLKKDRLYCSILFQLLDNCFQTDAQMSHGETVC